MPSGQELPAGEHIDVMLRTSGEHRRGDVDFNQHVRRRPRGQTEVQRMRSADAPHAPVFRAAPAVAQDVDQCPASGAGPVGAEQCAALPHQPVGLRRGGPRLADNRAAAAVGQRDHRFRFVGEEFVHRLFRPVPGEAGIVVYDQIPAGHQPRVKIPQRVGDRDIKVAIDMHQAERQVVRHLGGGFRKVAFDVSNILITYQGAHGFQRGVLELHLVPRVHALQVGGIEALERVQNPRRGVHAPSHAGEHGRGFALVGAEFGDVAAHPLLRHLVEGEAEEVEAGDVAVVRPVAQQAANIVL